MKVKATREGLVGKKTASGYIIDTVVSFVALPATKALHKWIIIKNTLNEKVTYAQVLDVGPWYEHDDSYVFYGNRPLAESTSMKTNLRITNGAGIDLSEKVWHDLEMKDNTEVEWEFLP